LIRNYIIWSSTKETGHSNSTYYMEANPSFVDPVRYGYADDYYNDEPMTVRCLAN